eukprot:scaffold1203_cov74-Phaeocystis_antarctica.AAC.15
MPTASAETGPREPRGRKSLRGTAAELNSKKLEKYTAKVYRPTSPVQLRFTKPSGSRRARRPAPAARIDACRRPSNLATGSLEVEAAAPVAAAAAAAVGEN